MSVQTMQHFDLHCQSTGLLHVIYVKCSQNTALTTESSLIFADFYKMQQTSWSVIGLLPTQRHNHHHAAGSSHYPIKTLAIIYLSSLYLQALRICFVHGLTGWKRLKKTFVQQSNEAWRAMWPKGLAEGFGANVRNEMLLDSDSESRYQLASLFFPFSIFILFPSSATQKLQGKISFCRIHHFHSASEFVTKQAL